MKNMPSRKNQKPADQVRAFRKAARELGTDESESRFNTALRTIARRSGPKAKKQENKN
jgi:hypothetical protein